MRARAATLVGLLAITAAAPGRAQPIDGAATLAGTVRAIDGDTLDLTHDTGKTRVRLFGIDAPEGGQRCQDARGRSWTCGRAARGALEALTRGRRVTCRGRGLDDYGRLLAICSAGQREINATMIGQGLAWAFVRYSDSFLALEREARAARRGVFAAENAPPWDYRAERWEGATRTAETDRARTCPIKGNVSRSGQRIYHLPWQVSYARVSIDEQAGERWFCDEGEAEQAGWRRAR